MARIKNDLFKLTGTLGGLSFSQDEHGTVVKQKSTVSKKRIMTHPKSKGTRENMMEMGGASMAAKVLRLGFMGQRKGIYDRYFSGRLNGRMRLVVGAGEGLRGQRKLDIRKNGNLLEGFEFVQARPLLYSVGGITEKPTINAERNRVDWSSPALDRKKQITAHEDATHFKFILGAAMVSNYEFNTAQNKYFPLEAKFQNLATFLESEAIALTQKIIAPVSLTLKLSDTIIVPETVGVVSVVGVAFFRNVNGELLGIDNSGGMRILGVF